MRFFFSASKEKSNTANSNNNNNNKEQTYILIRIKNMPENNETKANIIMQRNENDAGVRFNNNNTEQKRK